HAAAGRRRWRGQLTRDGLKCRITAPPTVLNTLRKTRMAFRTHHDHERRQMSTVFTVETATARRSQLIARDADLQLRFDDLLGDVAANFDHAFIIGFARFRNSKHVLSGRKRGQNNSTGATDTATTLIVDIYLGA